MTEQEHNNRRFARELATVCYHDTANMNKCPIVLNSQQYKYFVEEWNKLNKKQKNGTE